MAERGPEALFLLLFLLPPVQAACFFLVLAGLGWCLALLTGH